MTERKSRETFVVPFAILIMIAMLAGVTYWRLAESRERADWVALVNSAPKLKSEAEGAIENAQNTIDFATTSSIALEAADGLKIKVAEAKTLVEDISGLLEYRVPVVPADSTGGLLADPLQVDTEASAQFTVQIPADFSETQKAFVRVEEQLEFAVQGLERDTKDLQADVKEVVTKAKSSWTISRDNLSRKVSDVQDSMDLDARALSDPIFVEELRTALNAAEQLLANNMTVPEATSAIDQETQSFDQAGKDIDAKVEQLNSATEPYVPEVDDDNWDEEPYDDQYPGIEDPYNVPVAGQNATE